MTKEEAIQEIQMSYDISEDAKDMAIEALQAQTTLDDVSTAYENGYRQGKFEAQQWIPCSERLPKTSGVYIVARWFGDGFEKRILSDACYFDGSDTWYDDTRLNHGREYVTHKIVAWMPLPSPYKGE